MGWGVVGWLGGCDMGGERLGVERVCICVDVYIRGVDVGGV